MSDLYLSGLLVGWPADLIKGEAQTSEVRGGKYAARVQEGYEKDGSPKYRYFKTQEEYEEYMRGKGGGKKKTKKKKDEEKDGEKRLESKRDKERKESAKKQRSLFTEAKRKKKEVETTKKSLTLYLEVQS